MVHEGVDDGGGGREFGCLEGGFGRRVADREECGGGFGVRAIVADLFVEEAEENFLFGGVGRAGREGAEGGGDEGGGIAGVFALEAFGEGAGGFDELRAVEQDEGLQGRVGGVATRDADDALRDVERFEHGGRAGTAPKRVETAAVEGLTFAGGGGFEGLGDVVGVDRRTTDFFNEQAAGGEGLVANHLGGEAMAGTAGEPGVLRIVGHDLRGREAALAVSIGEDDGFEEGFHIPARADEFAGEPVEEFGVLGAIALGAEVVGGLDEALTEEGLPKAIYGHAGQQRVIGGGEPAGKAEAVARLVGGESGKRRRGVGGDGGAAVVILAALEDVGGLRRGKFAHDHDLFGGVG